MLKILERIFRRSKPERKDRIRRRVEIKKEEQTLSQQKYDLIQEMNMGRMSVGNYHIARAYIVPMNKADYEMSGNQDDKYWRLAHVMFRPLGSTVGEERVLAWPCDENGMSYAQQPEIQESGSTDKYNEFLDKATHDGLIANIPGSVIMKTFDSADNSESVLVAFQVYKGSELVRIYANFDPDEFKEKSVFLLGEEPFVSVTLNTALNFLGNSSNNFKYVPVGSSWIEKK
jgi:hypothetical protein